MQIITINLPEKYLAALAKLTDMQKYPSRSKAVRVALKEFLGEELQNYQDLDDPEIYKALKKEGPQ